MTNADSASDRCAARADAVLAFGRNLTAMLLASGH
jgi:hypothetical protein